MIVVAFYEFLLGQPLRHRKILYVCLFPLLFANFNFIADINYIFSFVVL